MANRLLSRMKPFTVTVDPPPSIFLSIKNYSNFRQNEGGIGDKARSTAEEFQRQAKEKDESLSHDVKETVVTESEAVKENLKKTVIGESDVAKEKFKEKVEKGNYNQIGKD